VWDSLDSQKEIDVIKCRECDGSGVDEAMAFRDCEWCNGTGQAEATHCNGCEDEAEMTRPIDNHWWARRDYFGIFTGIYCDDCYNSNDTDKYPYIKDRYATIEYDGYGEQLEPQN